MTIAFIMLGLWVVGIGLLIYKTIQREQHSAYDDFRARTFLESIPWTNRHMRRKMLALARRGHKRRGVRDDAARRERERQGFGR